ncbi:MAG: hypothetical protein HHJ17_00180 [Rhodoferax sp.]|uniref:hypothetical protein n=1 Tax=Rhodoferax sp. TaxID=50421 RepID=UPI00178EFC23|nr:hypothetical protein [Rhodoferax sp.]NMM11946.1 hypothetical protein [Rhodoferax sp.]
MAISKAPSAEPKIRVKPGEAKEPRGPRYKKAPKPLSNEQLALLDECTQLSVSAQKRKLLTPQQVGAFVDREPKTLEEDRAKQRNAIAAGTQIDLTSPTWIPYAPPASGEKEVKYFLHDVLQYIDRVYSKVDRSFLKRVQAGNVAMRGFQSWLAYGSPADLWTFCIQPDGRPLSLAEAIATDRLTDDTQRLTIGEFSERIRHAASNSFSQHEKAEVGKGTGKPKEATKDRKDRWTKPSGPI